MGHGDSLIGSGLARGAAARGKRIAFGHDGRIIWDKHSAEIYRNNPNVAPPGSEGGKNLEWVPFYKGNRLYNRHDQAANRWVWNTDFRPNPGEVFFDDAEKHNGGRYGEGFVLLEPNIEVWKSSAVNKNWGRDRYQAVALALTGLGYRVCQFRYPTAEYILGGIERLPTRSFRDALAILSKAALYIGPEGGLHHGAAAVGKPGVVIFGGFIPPEATGYAMHANLTGGAEACGSLKPCGHCRAALDAISVDEVVATAKDML